MIRKHATLCYIFDENKVLLGLKKRGFAEGIWNGFGGKINDGESIKDAAVRETFEEAQIKVGRLEKVGEFDFFFTNLPEGKEWDQTVHVFIARDWSGKPVETEEMLPKWFDKEKIPLDRMWEDDTHWLPMVFEGKKVMGSFVFGKDNKSIHKYNIREVKNFDD